MQRTLASQRKSRFRKSGEVYRSNIRWIQEGKVTDHDILPWLRPVQLQGFELTIVGSSLDAVRVCIEAWNAGFKPVLIIIKEEEDEDAPSKEQVEMYSLLGKIRGWHSGVGVFTYGPRAIISEGANCTVRVDHKGRAVDVSVCTGSGNLNSMAETWELFKGPAIIVDDVATVDSILDDAGQPVPGAFRSERRGLFLSNMRTERKAVVKPSFWEDRYDPERLGFWALGYREIVPNLIFGLAQMVAIVAVHRYYKDKVFWVMRALTDAFMEVPCWHSLTALYGSALGLEFRTDRPTLLGTSFGVGAWLVSIVPMLPLLSEAYLSDFVGSTCSTFFVLATLLWFCKCIKEIEINRPMLLWFCAVWLSSFGVWFCSILILLAYLVALSWNRIAASVFLTLALSFLETQMIEFMMRSYNRFVWEPRRSQPNRVPGDQKLGLSTCVLAVHGLCETGRLVSMICGAVRARDATFLYTNAVAVFLGILINVADRSGWSGCLVVRHAGPRLRPYAEYLLCPTAVEGLHVDQKFAVGWPRFFLLAGLCIGRGCIHNNWQLTLAGHDPSAWCWNGIVLVTALMAFIGELAEDLLVYFILGHFPPPQWECFGSAMVDCFDMPGKDDIYHLSHYLVPQSAFLTPSADMAAAPSVTRTTVKDRLRTTQYTSQSSMKSKFMQDFAPALSVSPNFKHARYFSAFQLQHFNGGSIVMILTVMSVGLGRGNLFGFCRPTRLDAFATVLKNAVLWSNDCQAEVSF